ncbi:MAG: ABC transporter [Deltaproteobacteria bacterium]|nr:MAG: ABC transporter [Deltaproteobacteria bacterium]
MRQVLTLAGRELRGYFDSPVAYIVATVFLGWSGWMFFTQALLSEQANMRPFFAPSPLSPSMLLVILVPALTMRLIAEEKRTGTIELLTTLPIRDSQVITGKFLGAFAMLAIVLSLTLVFAVTLDLFGDLDWGPVLAGYLGLLLFGAALTALGLLCSTLTRNQVIAFIVAFLVCAALYFVYWLRGWLFPAAEGVLEYLSVSFHLDNLARGVIDTRDVVYYLTLAGGALFLAVRSLERQHN